MTLAKGAAIIGSGAHKGLVAFTEGKMTPKELTRYLALTASIARLQAELDDAMQAKQQLAQTLFKRNGKHSVYRIVDGDEQQDMMVTYNSKTGAYYFAPRYRYTKEARWAKAEQKRLDRAARLSRFPTQASVPRPTTNPEELKPRLPIVGDVDQPAAPREPRLLEIREPSEALLGDRDETT